MSSDRVAISLREVSKRYEIYDRPGDRLKQYLANRIFRSTGRIGRSYCREFWALRNVSLEVQRGETVGIIGRNGSGKSTLLQLVCGTLSPTSGVVEAHGRIGALLELGAGFNPEFTGRENVYLSASLHGLDRRAVDKRFDLIASFAGIGDFIDQPVKVYSSGMFLRLAFAVIAHVDADVMVIDEAFAVGDVFFQQKCMRFLEDFKARGGTILFVSHDVTAVKALCQRAVLLSRDPIPTTYQTGSTEAMCRLYLRDLYSVRASEAGHVTQLQEPGEREEEHGDRSMEEAGPVGETFHGTQQEENLIHVSPFRADAESFGLGGASIEGAWFEGVSGIPLEYVRGDRPTRLCIRVRAHRKIVHPAVGFMLKDHLGQFLFAEGTDKPFRQEGLVYQEGDVVTVEFEFTMPTLIRGTYTLNVAIAEGLGDDHHQHHWIHDAISLTSTASRLVHGICGVSNLSIRMRILRGVDLLHEERH